MAAKYSDLKDKRVFITGGGSGIGASLLNISANNMLKFILLILMRKLQIN